MTPLEKNIMRPRRRLSNNRQDDKYQEKVIEVNRVSRTVKGGRRIRFRALVVVGDKAGKVGMGIGKANEVSEAVSKANRQARKNLINVTIVEGTIPHEIIGVYGAARVLLRPASGGTSIVAGGSVRVVAELAGITDLLAKSLGSRSKINNVAATLDAFGKFSPRVVTKIQEHIDRKNHAGKISASKPLKPAEMGKEETADKSKKITHIKSDKEKK